MVVRCMCCCKAARRRQLTAEAPKHLQITCSCADTKPLTPPAPQTSQSQPQLASSKEATSPTIPPQLNSTTQRFRLFLRCRRCLLAYPVHPPMYGAHPPI